MAKRIGRYTLSLEQPAAIAGFASVVSKKEGEGPLGKVFDIVNPDTAFGEKTWERAESRMQSTAVKTALEKCSLTPEDLDYIFAGDLLNQCIGSTFGLRSLSVPFIGLFGACSTMAESLTMASLFVEGGFCRHACAVTSSHFCSAERQFRFPLEYGGQRTPTAQWTVTGSGAVVVSNQGDGPFVRQVTIGTIEDFGIKDANNMGPAMAPAAAMTISRFFEDTGSQPSDFDLILTGDLGSVGSAALLELLKGEGLDLSKNHSDCGKMIYDPKTQDVMAGGSGCGCSASVLCGHLLPQLRSGILKNVLFIATGALMSPTSAQQGESIPGIAHLLHLSSERGNG